MSPVFYVKEESHMVKINGNSLDAAGQTLAEYLTAANFEPQRIVVERNGEIVPRARYGETVLCDGDVVEIISFMGGG